MHDALELVAESPPIQFSLWREVLADGELGNDDEGIPGLCPKNASALSEARRREIGRSAGG
jgi:hypothetical protein